MSDNDQLPYATLLRKRAAYLGQVRKLSSAIDAFDLENDNAHVLKSSKETLATCVRNYQSVFEDMLEHTEADTEEIINHSETFRSDQTDVSAKIESKMDEVRRENVVDNIPSLKCDFVAINLSFREFKVFADETSPECVSPSEARVRLKDLEMVNQQYQTTWKQIYEKGNYNREERHGGRAKTILHRILQNARMVPRTNSVTLVFATSTKP